MTKYVYKFSEGDKDQKDLLGGKGANLAEMTNIGLPVPPGFTITTDACRWYMKHGEVPAELPGQVTAALEDVQGVIGTKDAYRGESVKAVVVLRAGHEGTTEQDIVDWCRQNMAVYKAPRSVSFVQALPKSGSGKVMWRTLQEREKAGTP